MNPFCRNTERWLPVLEHQSIQYLAQRCAPWISVCPCTACCPSHDIIHIKERDRRASSVLAEFYCAASFGCHAIFILIVFLKLLYWKHLVNLREAEELGDVTYFNSLPHMPLQVLCNYCFSSPTKELAHQFGTLTDFELPRLTSWEERKVNLYKGKTAFVLESSVG